MAYEVTYVEGAGRSGCDSPVDDREGSVFWSRPEEKIVESIVTVAEGARSILETIEHADDLVGKPLSDPPHIIGKVGAKLLEKQRPGDGIKGKSALGQVTFCQWHPIDGLEFGTVPPFGVK